MISYIMNQRPAEEVLGVRVVVGVGQWVSLWLCGTYMHTSCVLLLKNIFYDMRSVVLNCRLLMLSHLFVERNMLETITAVTAATKMLVLHFIN